MYQSNQYVTKCDLFLSESQGVQQQIFYDAASVSHLLCGKKV